MILFIFISVAINAVMVPTGCNIALTGIILSSLRGTASDIHMTKDEESWFGKYMDVLNLLYTPLIILNLSLIHI